MAADVQGMWAVFDSLLGSGGLGAASEGDDAGWSAERLAAVEGLIARIEESANLLATVSSTAALAQSIPASVAAVRSQLAEAEKLIENGVRGRFVWVDGPLVVALQRGSWLLLDNANLCNPSVLDRLNPLLERGGVLQLPECGLQADGSVRELTANDGFRLILTVDPSRGELSRAMRNRGVEVSLLPMLSNSRDMLSMLQALETDAPANGAIDPAEEACEETAQLTATSSATPLLMMAAHETARARGSLWARARLQPCCSGASSTCIDGSAAQLTHLRRRQTLFTRPGCRRRRLQSFEILWQPQAAQRAYGWLRRRRLRRTLMSPTHGRLLSEVTRMCSMHLTRVCDASHPFSSSLARAVSSHLSDEMGESSDAADVLVQLGTACFEFAIRASKADLPLRRALIARLSNDESLRDAYGALGAASTILDMFETDPIHIAARTALDTACGCGAGRLASMGPSHLAMIRLVDASPIDLQRLNAPLYERVRRVADATAPPNGGPHDLSGPT